MTQSKKMSAFESIANVIIGYSVAVCSQIVLYPFFDIHVPIRSNILLGLWFTFISLVRSYCVRRTFNKIHEGRKT